MKENKISRRSFLKFGAAASAVGMMAAAPVAANAAQPDADAAADEENCLLGLFQKPKYNFLIVAFVLFVVIKTINALHKKPAEPEAPAEPTTKVCPYCQSEISIKAVRCPHCTSKLEGFPEINN